MKFQNGYIDVQEHNFSSIGLFSVGLSIEKL